MEKCESPQNQTVTRSTRPYHLEFQALMRETAKHSHHVPLDNIQNQAHVHYVINNPCTFQEAFEGVDTHFSYLEWLSYMKDTSSIVKQWGHDSLHQ